MTLRLRSIFVLVCAFVLVLLTGRPVWSWTPNDPLAEILREHDRLAGLGAGLGSL